MNLKIFTLIVLTIWVSQHSIAQHSVARQWNEVLLEAIRNDNPRPTVHARNLYHVSASMYDAWAAYDEVASTVFLGNTIGNYYCEFNGVTMPSTQDEIREARETAMSYAAYRLLKHRFQNSPGSLIILPMVDSLFDRLGYDPNYTSVEYENGNPAALGNYIALSCMEIGFVDGSNEEKDFDFEDEFYQPINPPLFPSNPGAPGIIDQNHWQPLAIDGNPARRFLSPHWSSTIPFALDESHLTTKFKGDKPYQLYHDPGLPALIDTTGELQGLDDFYKWNFAIVAVWAGHLDPENTPMIDISPNSIGNTFEFPTTEEEFRNFYQFIDGGILESGYEFNPTNGKRYEEQLVPLGDFGRVLAEFWADGPRSETPPGHWFTILNSVSDSPQFIKKFRGTGPALTDLEWDVKAYLALSGAMHDVAISVWGVKSYYDYIRPISAIRSMADFGQSSDSTKISFHPNGIPLIDGHIELVLEGDDLIGEDNENLGKIKIWSWKGPDHISDAENDVAGVGWILAENWWPYQKPNFVTPPFAGYVSGHSTFSRSAAEILTLLTGDPFFPGGMGVFKAPKNEYLVFEKGPSMDVELQWASYRDAADQASLSRIWGGIHPPIDDIPGRKIGKKIGIQSFQKALDLFNGVVVSTQKLATPLAGHIVSFPNPAKSFTTFDYSIRQEGNAQISVHNAMGKRVKVINLGYKLPGVYQEFWQGIDQELNSGIYFYQLEVGHLKSESKKIIITQ